MTERIIEAAPLTAAAFAPFGTVIETEGHTPLEINNGTCERFNDLAPLDVQLEGGRPLLSIFRARPCPLPLEVRTLERHPLSSQSFYPLDGQPFLIVVGLDRGPSGAAEIRAFYAAGSQGVSYARNTWHHALLAIGQTSRFVVVDRGGPRSNCEERAISPAIRVTAPLDLASRSHWDLPMLEQLRIPIG